MLVECDCATRTISISQEALINSTLAHLILADATPVQTPLAPGYAADFPTSQDEKEEMVTRPCGDVCALAWLALGTRCDIAFATSTLVRYGRNPGGVHLEAVKRV